ncbi:MAG: DNA primase [Anaplasmataceae bacterium]|nr:DNA primase [Anaplasmataceae bacterium]
MYTPETLETLRQRIDLIDVLSSHVDLKRSGATFKACCPFHEEKTPSFMVKRGDSHYHCFGCGAHGDAIAFLMTHLRMGFTEAVEHLAERFQVALVKADGLEFKGPSKTQLKEALEYACQFYHYLLLYSEEGHVALSYLYSRGIDLSFITRFQLGYAPKQRDSLLRFAHEKGISDDILEQTGLMKRSERGKVYDFFCERVLFPIRDGMGAVIGFSGRKFQEATPGGKYVNTPETVLFKKSHVLFGLSYSRKRIAKERKAVVVEGQIDALKLIEAGFDYTVAGQGTAFGEGHVQELLQLGIKEVFLALDSDEAGQEATFKIGGLFQKKGVAVKVASLPKASDPDSFLKEKGPEAFGQLLELSQDYLQFAFHFLSRHVDLNNPAHKSALIEELSQSIRSWDHPVMIYESLKELAKLAKVPEEALGGISSPGFSVVKKNAKAGISKLSIDPDRILEIDLLRWVLLSGPEQAQVIRLVTENLPPEMLRIASCRHVLELCIKEYKQGLGMDLLRLSGLFDEALDTELIPEIMQKKVNLQKAYDGCKITLKALLERNWMEEMEEIKQKIQSGTLSDEEAMEFAKRFTQIRKTSPKLKEL